MFKGYVISSVSIWLAAVLASYWFFYTPSTEAREAYRQLMEYSDQSKKEFTKDQEQYTRQSRKQVSKQILYCQEGQRLQTRLNSAQSELVFGQKRAGTELVEHFQDVDCTQQEKVVIAAVKNSNRDNASKTDLEALQQMLRNVKAREAVYSYKTGKLEAQDVMLTRYLLPAGVWPVNFEGSVPLIKGRAKKIEFTFFNEPAVKAEGFQAILNEWGEG
jgi:hypothetical protein